MSYLKIFFSKRQQSFKIKESNVESNKTHSLKESVKIKGNFVSHCNVRNLFLKVRVKCFIANINNSYTNISKLISTLTLFSRRRFYLNLIFIIYAM